MELFRRYEGNPILRAADWPYTVNAVFNPGVARLGNETILLIRVEDRTGFSHLCVARSPNGLSDWTVDADRFLPDLATDSERFGVEDPRITLCDDEYMIVYTGYSSAGPLVCLASTRDFASFERRGVLMSPENKDAALFPYRFGGRWALIQTGGHGTPPHGTHLALVEPRPSPLGRPHDPAGGARRRLVGCQ